MNAGADAGFFPELWLSLRSGLLKLFHTLFSRKFLAALGASIVATTNDPLPLEPTTITALITIWSVFIGAVAVEKAAAVYTNGKG